MVHTWLVTRLIPKPCVQAVCRDTAYPKPCVPLSVKITLLLTHGSWHGLFLSRVPSRVSRGGVFFFEKCFTNLISDFLELDYIISRVSHVLYYDSKPVLTCQTQLKQHLHNTHTSNINIHKQNILTHNSKPKTELDHARTRNPTIPTSHSTLLYIPNITQHKTPLLHTSRVPISAHNTNTTYIQHNST